MRCTAGASSTTPTPAQGAAPTPMSVWQGGRWAAPSRRPTQAVEVPAGSVAVSFILKKEVRVGPSPFKLQRRRPQAVLRLCC